jgi:uncharacterized protein DUF5667
MSVNGPLQRPQLRAEFRKRLRADLMNEAVALAEERRARSRSLGQRISALLLAPQLRAVAVVATLVILLAAGAGAAAASSLPGDPAFAIKRAAEQVEVALAPTPDARVKVLAAQEERRLDELERTVSRPERAPTASAEYEAAVRRFAAAVEALRTAPADERHEDVEQVVEAARDKHIEVLEELRERLPASAQPGIERAIEVQERIVVPAGPAPHPSTRPERTPGPGDQRRGEPTPPATSRRTSPRETERPRGSETQHPEPTETPGR